MNEIAKKATAERFLKALQKEGISKSEAGANIGLPAAQVSYLFNEKYWDRLGVKYWEMLLKWANSGYSLMEYPRHHPEAVLKAKVDEIMKNGIDPVARGLFQQSIDDVAKEQRRGAPFDEELDPPEHIASGTPADDEITNIDDLFENGQLDQDKVSNYLTDAYNKERAKLVGKIANNDQIILNFIKTYSTKVKTSPGTAYYFLPFWIEVTDNNAGYKFVSLNNIPEDLKKAIKILRGE